MQRRGRDRVGTVSVKVDCPSSSARDTVLVFENITQENTVLDVKRRVFSACNVPVNHQRFFIANLDTSAQSERPTELRDEATLADLKVELGWKNPRFNVPGDILELRTVLPMREYYPGGKHWCQSWSVAGTSQRESRMSFILILFLGCIVVYMILLSCLTSQRI